MAQDVRTKVYLGYEDEYVTEKHRSLVNFTTNKIGGKPVSDCSETLSFFFKGLRGLVEGRWWVYFER